MENIPLNTVSIEGETIKKAIFMDIAGGNKTFLFFESGNVLIMPIYGECKVQFETKESFEKSGRSELLAFAEQHINQTVADMQEIIEKLKDL